MEKISILEDISHIKVKNAFNLSVHTLPGYLFQYCRMILISRVTLRGHVGNLTARKINIYTCMKYDEQYNRLNNMKKHKKTHKQLVKTNKASNYSIGEVSHEAVTPQTGINIPYKSKTCLGKLYYKEPSTLTRIYILTNPVKITKTNVTKLSTHLGDNPKDSTCIPTMPPMTSPKDPRSSSTNLILGLNQLP